MIRRTTPLIICLLFFAMGNASAHTANTGKIKGKVTDQQTGDALPGANVIIEGTNIGAATDINGDYIILNVPPGTYTLRVSFIGYATMRVENLRVNIGLTTTQNFAVNPEVISGEEVVIVAERPLVTKDLTASQKITTAEEIEALPVTTFFGVLTTQAGVNLGAGGEIHIRGGRSNEVGYYIDGVSVSNPFFTNGLSINVTNKALEELRVVSGAFNAEYGGAMSGIVNISVKEGSANYHGSLSAYTGDYVSNANDLFVNIDDIDPFANTTFEGNLTGPMPFTGRSNKFTFNLSGRHTDNQGHLSGIREHLPSDSANFINQDVYYIELGGDSSFVPMNWRKDSNFLGKFTYRFTPSFKISTQILHDRTKWRSYSHAWKYNPDGLGTSRDRNNNVSFKVNQAFSKSFYEAHFFVANTKFENFLYEDPADPRYVATNTVRGTPPTTTFLFGGTQMGQTFRDSESLGFKLDYTNQINLKHEIKTGVNYRKDELKEEIFTILYDRQQYFEPTVLPANESPSHIRYKSDVDFMSAYIQDKIEYESMIINAGIRYDRFDPKTTYFIDLLDPEGERTKATVKQMVSPRLGVAFPITDKGILHFSYGHFYQMPTLRRLYLAQQFGAGLAPTVGYGNLKPEKTVNYEFGLQQQFGNHLAIDANVFFKDIRDLLASQSIRYDSERFGPSNYAVYLNKDYGSVRGFTLSLTKRHDPTTLLSAWVDYTFQTTQGNDVRSGSFYYSELSGLVEEKDIVPLAWDQNHLLNTTITISKPGNWGVSFIAKFASGWPHTPNIPFANYVPDANSGRKPSQKNVDVRFHKTFKVTGFDLVFFTQVFNLFDTRNERFVFDDTGRAGYTFVNRSSQETRGFISHYGEPGIHTWSEYQIRPNFYSAPRNVQLGLSLEF